MKFKLIPDTKLKFIQGNYNACVKENHILIPQELYTILLNYGLTSLVELINTALEMPDSLGTILEWSEQEVNQATQTLITQLRGKLEDKFLEPTQPFNRGLGALDPGELEK